MSLLFRRRHEEVSAGGARFSGLRSLRELLTRARCVLCGDGTETVEHFVNEKNQDTKKFFFPLVIYKRTKKI